MPDAPRIEVLEDVPDTAVKDIVQRFKRDGAAEVFTQLQPNGNWRVKAVFGQGARIFITTTSATTASNTGNVFIEVGRSE